MTLTRESHVPLAKLCHFEKHEHSQTQNLHPNEKHEQQHHKSVELKPNEIELKPNEIDDKIKQKPNEIELEIELIHE
jgi:hypothetical protein